MEEAQVRERAEAVCDALVAGDVGKATEAFSKELRQNLGEVVALLPLPASEATIESIERGSSAFVVVLRLVGETEEVLLQTRWKERDGQPTLIELSHLSATEKAIQSGELEPDPESGDGDDAAG
jgi:hypothetical protein